MKKIKEQIKTNLKNPCNECPFRKNSLPGYLGGIYTPLTLHQHVMSENVFACHKTIKKNNQKINELEICVGSIMYMNKNAKRCNDELLFNLQEEFRTKDTKNILSYPELSKYHKNSKDI